MYRGGSSVYYTDTLTRTNNNNTANKYNSSNIVFYYSFLLDFRAHTLWLHRINVSPLLTSPVSLEKYDKHEYNLLFSNYSVFRKKSQIFSIKKKKPPLTFT